MAKRGRKPRAARVVESADWTCPAHLDGVAAAAWDHVVGLLRQRGTLERTDANLVEAYAVNMSLLRESQRTIASDGPYIDDRYGNTRAHPACGVVNVTTMRLKAIANELELTPSSSKGIPVRAEEKQDDKWSGLFGVVGG